MFPSRISDIYYLQPFTENTPERFVCQAGNLVAMILTIQYFIVRVMAGSEMQMKGSVTTSEIVADIKRVAFMLNQVELSRSEYLQHSSFSEYRIYDGGNTWEALCDAAEIRTKKTEPVSDEVYFERLQQAVQLLGRLPKTTERKQFGLNFSKSRYPTLGAFIDKAVRMGIIEPQLASDASLPKLYEQTAVTTNKAMTNNIIATSEEIERERSIPPIPKKSKRNKWERIDIDGFPYAPQEEAGVIALFSILCSRGHINWQILDLQGGKGIDAVCYDNNDNKEIQVELKYSLSRSSWNHPIDDVDYVVCWLNRWADFPKPVIELYSFIRTLTV